MEFLGIILNNEVPTLVKIGYVEFLISIYDTNSIHIDRVFIPENKRGRGLMTLALKELVREADRLKIPLMSANVMPDDNNSRTYEKLRTAMGAVGFTPIEMDGTIYRNDLERILK